MSVILCFVFRVKAKKKKKKGGVNQLSPCSGLPATYRGVLYQKGLLTWARRICLISDGHLMCFKTNRDTKPVQEFSMQVCLAVLFVVQIQVVNHLFIISLNLNPYTAEFIAHPAFRPMMSLCHRVLSVVCRQSTIHKKFFSPINSHLISILKSLCLCIKLPHRFQKLRLTVSHMVHRRLGRRRS